MHPVPEGLTQRLIALILLVLRCIFGVFAPLRETFWFLRQKRIMVFRTRSRLKNHNSFHSIEDYLAWHLKRDPKLQVVRNYLALVSRFEKEAIGKQFGKVSGKNAPGPSWRSGEPLRPEMRPWLAGKADFIAALLHLSQQGEFLASGNFGSSIEIDGMAVNYVDCGGLPPLG